jgi:hypothetical protein
MELTTADGWVREEARAVEMHQIRYFLALCKEFNFTKAAERCNVAQPSLTRAIKLLEEEFGGPLVHRERVNTHLTELGRMVRPFGGGLRKRPVGSYGSGRAQKKPADKA